MVDIYAVGLCSMSLCAPKDMSKTNIELEANKQHPTGVSPWQIAEEETFADGTEMPKVRERHKDHLHWLLHC